MGEMGKGFCPNFLQPFLENIDRRSCTDGSRELIPVFHNPHRKCPPSPSAVARDVMIQDIWEMVSEKGKYIFTSSAKRKAESPRAAGRSFNYNRKSNEPMTEPWGTPLSQEASSERTPSIWTWHGRFDRYDLIQFNAAHSMPEDFSLASRKRRLTESNAFAKSRFVRQTGYASGSDG